MFHCISLPSSLFVSQYLDFHVILKMTTSLFIITLEVFLCVCVHMLFLFHVFFLAFLLSVYSFMIMSGEGPLGGNYF